VTWEADDGTPSTPIGQLLDSLGVQGVLREGDLPSEAIVILKVVGPEGKVRVQAAWSEGMDFITRRGLLDVALVSERFSDSEEGHQ